MMRGKIKTMTKGVTENQSESNSECWWKGGEWKGNGREETEVYIKTIRIG